MISLIDALKTDIYYRTNRNTCTQTHKHTHIHTKTHTHTHRLKLIFFHNTVNASNLGSASVMYKFEQSYRSIEGIGLDIVQIVLPNLKTKKIVRLDLLCNGINYVFDYWLSLTSYFLVRSQTNRISPSVSLYSTLHIPPLGRVSVSNCMFVCVSTFYSTLYGIWGEYQFHSVCLSVCVCLCFQGFFSVR